METHFSPLGFSTIGDWVSREREKSVSCHQRPFPNRLRASSSSPPSYPLGVSAGRKSYHNNRGRVSRREKPNEYRIMERRETSSECAYRLLGKTLQNSNAVREIRPPRRRFREILHVPAEDGTRIECRDTECRSSRSITIPPKDLSRRNSRRETNSPRRLCVDSRHAAASQIRFKRTRGRRIFRLSRVSPIPPRARARECKETDDVALLRRDSIIRATIEGRWIARRNIPQDQGSIEGE